MNVSKISVTPRDAKSVYYNAGYKKTTIDDINLHFEFTKW